MATVFDYTKSNVLVIPQALYGMDDVEVIISESDSVIFYKCLENDLVDVEFYTNAPCLVYIESGKEVLTDSRNRTIELLPGSAVLFSQGINLHSDYVKLTDSLKAYLVFFNQEVIDDFLAKMSSVRSISKAEDHYYLMPHIAELSDFFESFFPSISSPGYVNTKLCELLHLLVWKGDRDAVCGLLHPIKNANPKRNLARLLDSHDVLRLSVSDLANLSGRSVSTFNRDFKELYKVPPKKWLQEKRLKYAKQLLEQERCSVTEAAMEVGYENVSNFIKAFKTKYDVTPKQVLSGFDRK